MNQINF